MAEILACDVAYYQPPVDDTYPHRWLTFRCCDGGFPDPNAAHNAAWAKAAVQAGRMDGWTTYVVYRPGQNTQVLAHLDRLGLAGGHVMIDVESWQGQIRGDHSDEINDLARQVAARIGWDRVWCYGNRTDLAALAPRRDARMRTVLASYGGTRASIDGQVGWQYTDGTWTARDDNGQTLPSSSPPFGPCDHNVLYDPLPAGHQPASSGTTPIPVDLGGDMYELVRDEQGAIYQVSALVFRHIPTIERWRIAQASPLCIGQRTRQINNRERDCLRADVTANLAALRKAS